jgi:hypothetical protein
MHAEGILATALEYLKNKGNVSEALAHEEFGLLLKGIDNRESEGQTHLDKAEEISAKLPYWAERSIHLHIPIWHIN